MEAADGEAILWGRSVSCPLPEGTLCHDKCQQRSAKSPMESLIIVRVSEADQSSIV